MTTTLTQAANLMAVLMLCWSYLCFILAHKLTWDFPHDSWKHIPPASCQISPITQRCGFYAHLYSTMSHISCWQASHYVLYYWWVTVINLYLFLCMLASDESTARANNVHQISSLITGGFQFTNWCNAFRLMNAKMYSEPVPQGLCSM